MQFEQAIVTDVKSLLPDSKPYFFNGTLFIAEVDNTDANTALDTLSSKYDGKIIMSELGFEYAFDFC